MDAYYDTKAAREYLETLMSVEKGGDSHRLASITKVSVYTMEIQTSTHPPQSPDWTNGMNISEMNEPQTWRLLKVNDVCVDEGDDDEEDGGEIEEMIFAVRGAICAMDLPPISEKPS